jgi:type II secretory pathway pseudopilin PulG
MLALRSRSKKNGPRTGFSLLELEVAFVLLGIALAGLGPLVVMQSRQLKRLESRFRDQTTYYLAPSENRWARKLGASALIQTEDPGSAPPPVTLIDNGDPGYREIDLGMVDWTSLSRPDAFQGTLRRQDGSGVGDRARWEFTDLEPGWYEVLVTYSAGPNQATNAPYGVYDGTTCEGTVPVDQSVAPSGATYLGVPWESLGLFSIYGEALHVELRDSADNDIVADAVRIVPVRNDVRVLSLEKSLTGEEATAHVSVILQVP